jgi:toxin CcdB
MIKQFNVYKNNSAATNKQLPYYMVVQHDCYDDLATRIIIPLIRRRSLPLWQSRAAPCINIDFESFLIYEPMITNLETGKMSSKDFVCNLQLARRDVIAALDALITNT